MGTTALFYCYLVGRGSSRPPRCDGDVGGGFARSERRQLTVSVPFMPACSWPGTEQ